MSILAQSESQQRGQRKLEEIAIVLRAVRSVTRRCLEFTIEGLLNRWVTAGVAGDPLEPAPWRCPRCQTDKRSAFQRNGSYSRRLQTLAGLVVLQVPRLRCRCGAGGCEASMPPQLGPSFSCCSIPGCGRLSCAR